MVGAAVAAAKAEAMAKKVNLAFLLGEFDDSEYANRGWQKVFCFWN